MWRISRRTFLGGSSLAVGSNGRSSAFQVLVSTWKGDRLAAGCCPMGVLHMVLWLFRGSFAVCRYFILDSWAAICASLSSILVRSAGGFFVFVFAFRLVFSLAGVGSSMSVSIKGSS